MKKTFDFSQINFLSLLPPSREIKLVIQGMGHVPSKKNKHYASATNSQGKRRVLLDKPTKEWLKKATASFVFQLISNSLTTEGAIQTAAQRQSLIASLPRDDAWRFIPLTIIYATKVEPGNEGCEITIKRL